ncbi:hypothetical protein LWI29_034398 [Acer saccharum]|uniref:Uncharacterized protein n=1 Tax=Acer saccharum TaxID=4024 RepID=A0AA39VI12_ACESA|nr:hypothetical protein LWI29_034398 [Acer saccharum]
MLCLVFQKIGGLVEDSEKDGGGEYEINSGSESETFDDDFIKLEYKEIERGGNEDHWDDKGTMKNFRLAIDYNGQWDNLDYVDWQLIGELVENKVIKLRSRWTKYRLKRDNDIDFVFCDDSPIKEIYVDMEKRVGGGGGGGGGGDGHVHKLPPSLFKYNNVGCYTTDSDTEDEKPNEHDYPSSPDDTFVGVEHGAGVEDGIGGTMNCSGTGGVTFGGPSHDPFYILPLCIYKDDVLWGLKIKKVCFSLFLICVVSPPLPFYTYQSYHLLPVSLSSTWIFNRKAFIGS